MSVREPDEATSGDEETIRAVLLGGNGSRMDALAGLDRLAADRDEATERYAAVRHAYAIEAQARGAAEAEVAVLTARLDAIEAALPDTFYEGLTVDERVARLVDLWRRAIESVRVVEEEADRLTARLTEVDEALRASLERELALLQAAFDFVPTANRIARPEQLAVKDSQYERQRRELARHVDKSAAANRRARAALDAAEPGKDSQ